MAYTKIIALRQSLNKAIDYTLNAEKTDLKSAIEYATNKDKSSDEKTIFEDAINCLKDDAFETMIRTKKKHNKTGGILGYHIIHSYKPGETTPQIAHEISTEFAKRCFGDRYEVVISTHLDKKHLHSHIVINSVSFVDGKKYRSDFKSYYNGIRKTNDDVCREYGLSIINPDINKKSLTYIDWLNLQRGTGTYRDSIKADIDQAIAESFSYGEFLVTMEELGYDVKLGKHVAFRPAGKDRFARGYNLGRGYSEDEIRARIDDSSLPPVNAYAVPTKKQREQYKKNSYMPDVERRYLWMMYQLGLVQKRQSPPKVTKYLKEELDKLEKYKEQQKFLTTRNLNKESEFSAYVSSLDKDIKSLRAKLTDFNSVKKQNERLYDALHDRAYYKKAHELFGEGYAMMKEENGKFLKALKTLSDSGFNTDQEIAVLENEKSNIYGQIADVKKDMRFHRNEKRICNNIIKTMEYIDAKQQLIEERKQLKEKEIDTHEHRK
jgi:hypothetical protein